MDDAIWKLLGFILSAVLLFAIPTMALLERQDDVTQSMVQAEANRFVDTARDMGYISPQLYTRFSERLQATGLHYNIRIRHEKRTWIPVYDSVGTGLVFTGNYDQSRVVAGEADVLATLFPTGGIPPDEASLHYNMHAGDLLFVEVRSRGETMADAMRRWLWFGQGAASGIWGRAGGMVRNEAN